jgi:hypothetical protein
MIWTSTAVGRTDIPEKLAAYGAVIPKLLR